jgi:hypothetical protein
MAYSNVRDGTRPRKSGIGPERLLWDRFLEIASKIEAFIDQ